MKKYAVAVCNLLNNENKIEIVTANTEIDAIIIAVEGTLLKNIICESVKDLQQYYFDGDLSVSVPVVIQR